MAVDGGPGTQVPVAAEPLSGDCSCKSRARGWDPWLMRLRSTDGASVELHITGYEFPDYRVPVVEVAINWLRAVPTASQQSPVVDGEPEELLEFLEPDIAFSVEERTADRVRIRVHFSLEARPPWLQGAEEPGLYEYFVRLDVSAEELTHAAESWMLGLTEFPER
jgi:hypothetical protein